MSDDIILSVDNLMMQFGGIKALNDVSLKVKRNSIFALIGPNGAGKTTVFNCLTGFYKASGGRIELNVRGSQTNVIQLLGERSNRPTSSRLRCQPPVLQDVRRHPPGEPRRPGAPSRTFACSRKCRCWKTCWWPSTCGSTATCWPASSTPRAIASESDALDHAFYWLEVVDLVDCANRWPVNCLYGQQRRLEIARAMCTRPQIICLDEPAAGLNPQETEALSAMIRLLRDEHDLTVVLIEHDMGMVMSISDHIVVLDHGNVIAEGGPGYPQRPESDCRLSGC
jgi:branched-chain amino acid transport system ATP-binding protein